ncbi:hypothetical protein H0H93_015823 [Arthromyces matolae]|nr:hypothetical protein H0H93_015823 [Arthromyces matolae]
MFYLFLQREGAEDILDFWLDVQQHENLCRAYFKDVRKSGRTIRDDWPQYWDYARRRGSIYGTVVGLSADGGGTKRSTASTGEMLSEQDKRNLAAAGSSHDEKARLGGRSVSPRPGTAAISEYTRVASPGEDGKEKEQPRSTTPFSLSGRTPTLFNLRRASRAPTVIPRSAAITRLDLVASAERIFYRYLSPAGTVNAENHEIYLPPSLRIHSFPLSSSQDPRNQAEESLLAQIPDIFHAQKEYCFRAMEQDAFPRFLRSKAFGNLTPVSALVRLIVGLITLWIGLSAAFSLVFLDVQPKSKRFFLFIPFTIAIVCLISHQYELDPILVFFGQSETTPFRTLTIREPYVRKLLLGRAIWPTGSVSQNTKAQLANAYNELGKELSSTKIRVIGNYTLGKVIGEGAYGKVRLGTHRLTSTRVAIKQIPKAMSASLTREIHHHRQLHHPHVAQMYEVIATESSIWIVTELCSGGELFDYLVEKGRLSEDEAKLIFGQLCLAVAYLHNHGIVHRDLKLENVLLDERCRVKLGDFGFTRGFEKGVYMETFCGTTGYASPEMLEGKKYQGPEVDVWSLGIILYTLLTGTLPFDDDDESVMRQMIIKGDFEDPDWLSIDPQHPDTVPSSESSVMSTTASPLVSTSEFTSTPTTPDEIPDDPFEIATNFHHNTSEATIRKLSDHDPLQMKMKRPETVREEEPRVPSPPPLRPTTSSSSKAPPTHPVRTPARTKRRSVSSNLSDPASPTAEKPPPPLPIRDVDFASLLSKPMPIIFSSPLERQILNTLSMLGFDTAQIVHSVLSDACDATGALWWLLKKKAEKRQVDGDDALLTPLPHAIDSPSKPVELKPAKKRKVSTGIQTDPMTTLSLARSAPQLAFVPPTPTFRTSSPTRPTTPTRSHLLSPSDASSKSHPSTPASSVREKDSKGRKARSGSVSIMQRATTALEAAGLVRKKSAEAFREEKDKERERSRDMERRMASGEEPRSSHGSSSSTKLTKSPPLKPVKDHPHPPSTPPPSHHLPQIGSPWVLADVNDREGPSHNRVVPPTPSNTPGDGFPQSVSTPNFSEGSNSKASGAPQRNRANILTAFRLWFHEDRKGKRKEASNAANSHVAYRPVTSTPPPFNSGTSKRRGSNGGNFGGRGHRPRASASSRRSSSVNSRRSSGTSVQMLVMDSPQMNNRRSFGSHTPNSERGDYPSRPSSIRSFSMQHHTHRKSPSQSSTGSAHLRTSSPMQRYHRRAGSGSSTTRVVRQSSRPAHMRSNSATSSIHSPTSSRPASFYELSESEGPRSTSPYKPSRRHSDEHRRPSASASATFVAQKRSGPFMSPSTSGHHTLGRSSWKKAWGLEPPGWQTRTAHLPVEVIAISPANEPISIRDVFSGRQSISLGDDDEWVDEDEDVSFVGGLGQMGMSSSGSRSSPTTHTEPSPPLMTLSPPPRGHRSTKNNHSRSLSSGSVSGSNGRQKTGHSPVERLSPVSQEHQYDSEARSGGRRQLPASRSGGAFRQPIQEEDEDEEE